MRRLSGRYGTTRPTRRRRYSGWPSSRAAKPIDTNIGSEPPGGLLGAETALTRVTGHPGARALALALTARRLRDGAGRDRRDRQRRRIAVDVGRAEHRERRSVSGANRLEEAPATSRVRPS